MRASLHSRAVRAGVLAAALAAPAAAQFAGLSWTTSGSCTTAAPGGIHLGVCGAGCGPLSSASAALPQGGFYQLSFTWASNDDCCSKLVVKVAGTVVFKQGDGFGAFCPPGYGPANPCSVPEQLGLEIQAGDLLELELTNTACFNYSTAVDVTGLVLGPPLPPSVSSVDPSFSWFPSLIKIHGQNFTSQSAAFISGAAVTVLDWKSNLLTVTATPLVPGFLDVVVLTQYGPGVLVDGVELRPSLKATASGVGGTLTVEHDTGAAGLFVLALGLQPLGAPLSLGSELYYGLLLDLAAPTIILDSLVLASAGQAQLGYSIPGNPALSGVGLDLQALAATTGLPVGSPGYSFTNLAVAVIP